MDYHEQQADDLQVVKDTVRGIAEWADDVFHRLTDEITGYLPDDQQASYMLVQDDH